jgi:hypothetical protein
MNIHQPILATTTITVHNVFVLRIRAMNPNISRTTLSINYKTTWSQPVTPIV